MNTGLSCSPDSHLLPLQALKLHQGIDILVSNAAVNPFFGNLMDVTEEVWNKVRGDEGRQQGTALSTGLLARACVKGSHRCGLVKHMCGLAPSVLLLSHTSAFSQLCLLSLALRQLSLLPLPISLPRLLTHALLPGLFPVETWQLRGQ